MLGQPKPRHLDVPVAVSLEELVPGDHFYRHLKARLDLNFVCDWMRDLDAVRGRPSIDPVVFQAAADHVLSARSTRPA